MIRPLLADWAKSVTSKIRRPKRKRRNKRPGSSESLEFQWNVPIHKITLNHICMRTGAQWLRNWCAKDKVCVSIRMSCICILNSIIRHLNWQIDSLSSNGLQSLLSYNRKRWAQRRKCFHRILCIKWNYCNVTDATTPKSNLISWDSVRKYIRNGNLPLFIDSMSHRVPFMNAYLIVNWLHFCLLIQLILELDLKLEMKLAHEAWFE